MWRFLLAVFHLSADAVCELSAETARDFHDYSDARERHAGAPMHWRTYHCRRCGAGFTI